MTEVEAGTPAGRPARDKPRGADTMTGVHGRAGRTDRREMMSPPRTRAGALETEGTAGTVPGGRVVASSVLSAGRTGQRGLLGDATKRAIMVGEETVWEGRIVRADDPRYVWRLRETSEYRCDWDAVQVDQWEWRERWL